MYEVLVIINHIEDPLKKRVSYFINFLLSVISSVVNARLQTNWDYFRFGLTVITAIMPIIGLVLVKYFIKDNGAKFKAVQLVILSTFCSWLCSLICAAKVALVPSVIIAANLITLVTVFSGLRSENIVTHYNGNEFFKNF